MKIAVGSSQTTSNIQGGGRSFGIKANGKAFKILSSSLYNYKPLAVVREISCNARDAHAMVGKLDVPFTVRLPSMADTNFAVRDFGPGLAEEDIFGLYTTYFESSKTESNDAIGGLGLGSKSPLSYSTSFQVVSYHGKMKRTYLAFQNDNGEPDIYKLTEQESHEPNGIEVIVPVLEADIRKFHRSAANVFRFFQTKPQLFSGVANGKPQPMDEKSFYEFDLEEERTETVVYEGTKEGRFYNNRVFSEISNEPVWAKMGDVIYPVAVKHVFEDGRQDEMNISRFFQSNRYGKLVIDFGIGELDINAGREGLSYDKATIARLKTVLSMIYTKLVQNVNAEIADSKSLDIALGRCHHYTKFFGNAAREGMFNWRGRSLNESLFRTLPSLYKNHSQWERLINAVSEANGKSPVRYSTWTSSRNESVVRALNSLTIDRHHLDFTRPFTFIIADEPANGSKGALRDRLQAALGLDGHYKNNVVVIRAVNLSTNPYTNNETVVLAHKPVAAARQQIAKVFRNQPWELFADIRFLSELPACVRNATVGSNGLFNGAVREKEEVYTITAAYNRPIHLYRTPAMQAATFDPEAKTEHLYVIGNKSKFKFAGTEYGTSRTTEVQYCGSSSYAVDALHAWAKEQVSTASSKPVVLHYLSETQAKAVEGNPNWVKVEQRIVQDLAKQLNRVGPLWNLSLSSPSLYDNDVYKAAMEDAEFSKMVGEWNAMQKASNKDREHLVTYVTTILSNVAVLIQDNWDAFVKAAGMDEAAAKAWSEKYKKGTVSLYFQDYVGKVAPLLVCISQRTTNFSDGWKQDVARLWSTSPNKITVADFIDRKLKGTF